VTGPLSAFAPMPHIPLILGVELVIVPAVAAYLLFVELATVRDRSRRAARRDVGWRDPDRFDG
jgi:hypothetical protein